MKNKFILPLIGIFTILIGCKQEKLPADNEARVLKTFKLQKVKPIIKYYKIGERNIATLQIGEENLPITILLHGSPGSGSDYDDYLKDSTIYQKTRLIAIDRPGYGFSDFGNTETSIIKQADIVMKIIEDLKPKQQINIVGYSFGGPVAARVAAMIPNKVKTLLLLAASIAPGEEKIFGISEWANRKNVKGKIPIQLRMANEEKLSHKTSLEEIEGDLSKILCPVYVLHGDKDNIIYYTNMAFIKDKMKNAKVETFTLKGKGHGFFFSETNLIKEYILKMVK